MWAADSGSLTARSVRRGVGGDTNGVQAAQGQRSCGRVLAAMSPHSVHQLSKLQLVRFMLPHLFNGSTGRGSGLGSGS